MATIRAISVRLKSVKSIQKITKSMKMVSAAKYARAERELKAARPLGETAEKFYRNAEIEKESDMKEGDSEKKKRNLLFIAVTSDRGLCGAVHTSVSKQIRNAMSKDKETSKIICIGDKARGILQRQYGEQFLFVCNEVHKEIHTRRELLLKGGVWQRRKLNQRKKVGRLPPTFLDASKVANEIFQSEYEFDAGKIVFNRFRSVVSYSTSELPLYGLATVLQSDKVQNYEDADEETLASFVEFSVAGLLYYAMKESACSEQSARMTAMDNASKNAGEMIDKLTLTFNRTRQAVITRELIEIISGASAL